MDLSRDTAFQVDCDRCGRRIGFYTVSDDLGSNSVASYPPGFGVYEKEREPLRWPYVRPTGRHRGRPVVGRETASMDRALQGRGPLLDFGVECGCGHARVIGLAALRRKLQAAPQPRISL